MSRALSPRAQQINMIKESVGLVLRDYARAKSGKPAPAVMRKSIDLQVASITLTPEAATEKYKKACDAFLADVISVRGIPTKVIGEPEQETITSSSGDWIAQHFDDLLPKIRARRDWVVSNYKDQAEAYYSRRLSDFEALLDEFLQDPPRLAKDTGPRITPIKKEIGYFARWNDTLYTLKAFSFAAEVDFIFSLYGRDVIAAIWRYSDLDERMDYPPESNHRNLDERVYAVRDNWAVSKGLMKIGPFGYVDDIDIPGRQTGCACHLEWVSALDGLPDMMLTNLGVAERDRRQEAFRKWIAQRNGDQRGFFRRIFEAIMKRK
jgi:hypothetical protein